MIRLLIAEDSPVVAQILRRLFDDDPEFEVLGVATDGDAVVAMAADLKPDVITMDVIMPKRDGVSATEKIMEESPTPIVVVSSHVNDKEMKVTFRSLAAGALSVLEKPENIFSDEFEPRRKMFVDTVRAMAGVKVVRRRKPQSDRISTGAAVVNVPHGTKFNVCVLGASTGGPQALDQALNALPADYPVPIIVAQHISRGFSKGLADWLDSRCALTVKMGVDGESCRPGTVYIAPDGTNIGIRAGTPFPRISIGPEQVVNVLTPSVDHLFQSAAEVVGKNTICGLMTGMGRDGAVGMAAVRKAGGYTFAESEETSIVFGMPAAAIELDAANKVLNLDMIGSHLETLVKNR